MAKIFENKNKDAEEWFSRGGYKKYQTALAASNPNGTPTLAVHKNSEGGGGGGGGGGGDGSSYYLSLLQQQQARAEQLAAQRQAAAQAAYDKNMAALNSAYAQRGDLLKQNYDDTLAQLQGQYDYGAGQVNQNADRAQQQAYINYMMSKRDLPQSLAALGLTGGASESRLAGLYNNYGNARNAVDTERNGSLASLLQTLNQNKSDALQNYNTALSDDEARKLAYQMELEQNLANQTADILMDKYDTLGELDSAYASQMAALQKRQADAAIDVSNWTHSAGNERDLLNTTQAQSALSSAASVYRSAINNGYSDDEAKSMALKDLWTSSWELGLSDDALDVLASQISGR